MARRTRFHADKARLQSFEEIQNLRAPKAPTHNHRIRCIDAVNLKDVLRKIQTDRDTLHGGRLPSVVAFTDDHVMAHRCRERGPSTPSGHHLERSRPACRAALPASFEIPRRLPEDS